MSNFIPLPPTYAVLDPQVRAVLDVLSRNMQVVIDSGAVTTANTALTSVGGASTFGSGNSSTNITNIAPAYTLDTLTADLKRGAAEVITGVTNGTTVMKLEPAGQYVVFQHKDASILGTIGAYGGTVRTGLGITSTGILGGYNRQADGVWQTTFAIESSTGNLTLLGELRANSVVNVGAYLGSTLVSTVVANSASVTTKLNKSAADILSGTIEFQSAGGFKTGTIAVDGSGNVTGAGVAITSRGIVGRNAGATTFTIDADTGAATFKGDITGASGTFTGSITGASGNFSGNLTAGNVTSSGATLGTNSGTNFWMRGSDGAAYFGGETTVKGRFTVSGSFNQSGFGDIGAYFTTNAGGATIYAVNTAAGGTINASNSGTGSACLLYNNTSGTFGLPTFWAQNSGTAVAGRFTSAGQAALFTSTGGGYAFIAFSSGATGATAFVQGDFALGYSDSRGDPWIMRAPSTSIAAAANYYLASDGTWKIPPGGGGSGTVTSVSGTGTVSGLSLSGTVTTSGNLTLGGTLSVTQSNLIASAPGSAYYLAGSGWSSVNPIMTAAITNSGTATVSGNNLNILGSTATGIAGAYVGTTGAGSTVTLDVRTTSPSDIRLKEEIANIDLGLTFVNQLRPVSYKLKADPKHQKGYGFIADEVDQLTPTGSSLVYFEPDWKVGDETGFKTIHYPSYIAVLTKAIQELSAKVTVLEAR